MKYTTKCNIEIEWLDRYMMHNPESGTLHRLDTDTGELGRRLGVNPDERKPLKPKPVHICGFYYKPETLAWFLIYNEWPKDDVVCKDGNRLNLRRNNLALKCNVTKSDAEWHNKQVSVILIHGQWVIKIGAKNVKVCESIDELTVELGHYVKEPKYSGKKNSHNNRNGGGGQDNPRNSDPAAEAE